jgi:histidinol-phosphate aminotransferase
MNVNLDNVKPYILSDRVISSDMTYLDWNEGTAIPDKMMKKIKNKLTDLHHYSDPSNNELKEALESHTGVDKTFIEVFNGSDSALDYTFRVLLNSNDKVCIPYPNYTQVNQTITSLGCRVLNCDISTLEENIKSFKPKVVYLSVPNNPLGYVYNTLPLAEKYSNTFFIVDEAYAEFFPKCSIFDEAYKYSNVIVTRTFSKGFGLAGIRLGYMTTNSYIMNKVRSINNFKQVNTLAAIAGVEALKDFKSIKANIDNTNQTKKEFLRMLKDYRVRDSHANFVLLEHTRAKEIINELKSLGILVRDRSKFINNTMRITIGPLPMMRKIAQIITKY